MQSKDEALWQLARRRAGFRKQLFSYIVVCAFLWAIWFVSGSHRYHYDSADYPFYGFYHRNSIPWPAWVMLWWGVALAFCFVKTYMINMPGSIEREYQQLKNKQ